MSMIPAASYVFTRSSFSATQFMCLLYVVLGSLAILFSLFDAIVFIVYRESRRRYVLFIALDFAEIINGISFIVCGYGRGRELYNGMFDTPITFHDCFFSKNWVIPLIMGGELPALVTVVISVERIIAVVRPKAYAIYWKPKFKLLLVIGVIAVEVLSIILARLSALNNDEMSNTRHCAIITSTSSVYSVTHFLFVMLSYVLSFASLLIVYVSISDHSKGKEWMRGGRAKGPQLKLLLCLTGAAIILVAMPSVVMIGIRLNLFKMNDVGTAITYSGPGCLAIATTIINFAFRPEYRTQLIQLFRPRYKPDNQAVFSARAAVASNATTPKNDCALSSFPDAIRHTLPKRTA